MLLEAMGTRISLTSFPSIDFVIISSLPGSFAKIETRSQPTRRCTSSRTERMISSSEAVWIWSVTSRIRRSVSSFAESSSSRARTSSPALVPRGLGMEKWYPASFHSQVNGELFAGFRRRNDFRDADGEVVAHHEDLAPRDEAVVDVDVDRIAHQAVERDDRAGAELEHVLHVQLRVAELHADLDVDVAEEVEPRLGTGGGGLRRGGRRRTG